MSTVDDLVRLPYPQGPPPPAGDGPPDFPLPSDVRELLTRVGSGFEVDNRFHFTVGGNLLEYSREHQEAQRRIYGSDEITVDGDRHSYRDGRGDYRIVFSDLLFVGARVTPVPVLARVTPVRGRGAGPRTGTTRRPRPRAPAPRGPSARPPR